MLQIGLVPVTPALGRDVDPDDPALGRDGITADRGLTFGSVANAAVSQIAEFSDILLMVMSRDQSEASLRIPGRTRSTISSGSTIRVGATLTIRYISPMECERTKASA